MWFLFTELQGMDACEADKDVDEVLAEMQVLAVEELEPGDWMKKLGVLEAGDGANGDGVVQVVVTLAAVAQQSL